MGQIMVRNAGTRAWEAAGAQLVWRRQLLLSGRGRLQEQLNWGRGERRWKGEGCQLQEGSSFCSGTEASAGAYNERGSSLSV